MSRWIIGFMLVFTSLAFAQELEVKMLAQGSALIDINGKQRMLRTGNTSPEGVTLVSADSQRAIVEVKGERQTLVLNRRISTRFNKASSAEVRIASARGGHHITPGRINGHPVEFMVDTGATTVALNYLEAERLGIDFLAGQEVQVSTANGKAKGFLVSLERVAVGNIELTQVEAIVSTSRSPEIILLGNSYLSRLNMAVEEGVLVLKARQ